MEKEQHTNVLESLFDKTTDYLQTRAELVKLKAIKKSSALASGLISKLILAMFLVFFLMIFNIGVALWLGELLHKTYYGFFALAGFYLIVGLIVYASRQKLLKEPITDSIIRKFHNN